LPPNCNSNDFGYSLSRHSAECGSSHRSQMASGCHEDVSLMKMFVEPNDLYLHSDFVDFKKSINGLLVIIEYELELTPFSDALFIFCNKKQDKIKVVYWDTTGFAMWYKVLQKQRFKWPALNELSHIKLSEQQLNGCSVVRCYWSPYTQLYVHGLIT
jgi:transposase